MRSFLFATLVIIQGNLCPFVFIVYLLHQRIGEYDQFGHTTTHLLWTDWFL